MYVTGTHTAATSAQEKVFQEVRIAASLTVLRAAALRKVELACVTGCARFSLAFNELYH